jgi:uncharacterized protein HemX
MKLSILLTALLIAAVPSLAGAAEADSTKRIDKRQDNQESRIEKGRESGNITKKEERKLETNQKKIDTAEKKAMADGKVTKKERTQVEKMQDKQNKAIANQRKDEQKKN